MGIRSALGKRLAALEKRQRVDWREELREIGIDPDKFEAAERELAGLPEDEFEARLLEMEATGAFKLGWWEEAA